MKALTLTQPWATLVAVGAKKIETRGWRTDYRGPLAIHAAKSFPMEAQRLCGHSPFFEALLAARWNARPLPTGVVLATCYLVDCLRVPWGERREIAMHADSGEPFSVVLFPPAEPERSFGDFTPGRYAWLLTEIKPLPEPVPARGSLGLWEWQP